MTLSDAAFNCGYVKIYITGFIKVLQKEISIFYNEPRLQQK